MLLDKLKSDVCTRLASVWPECDVYREKIPQGFVRPAFSVSAELRTHKKTLPGRAWREYVFSVAFFPGTDKAMISEVCEAAGGLFGQLGCDNGIVRCSPVTMKVEEETLRISFSAGMFVVWDSDGEDYELMQELLLNRG